MSAPLLSREEVERRLAGMKPEDWKAIGCDFAAVGGDLRRALEQHERERAGQMSDADLRIVADRLGWGVRRTKLGRLVPVLPEPKPSLWGRIRAWFERARPWWVWP